MSDSKPLNEKQMAFCRYYVSNGFNGTQAAISAGYSENTANEQAAQLLAKLSIKAFIAELTKGTVERAKATTDDIFEMLTDAATFDPSQFMDVVKVERVGKNGQPYEKVVLVLNCALSDLPLRVRRLVTNIKEGMFGVEVTWFSKEKALDMLARFHGMNQDKLKVESEYSGKSEAELLDIAKAKIAKLTLDE